MTNANGHSKVSVYTFFNMYFSAVKRLIASKIKVFVYKICVHSVNVLYTYIHTHTHTHMHVYMQDVRYVMFIFFIKCINDMNINIYM